MISQERIKQLLEEIEGLNYSLCESQENIEKLRDAVSEIYAIAGEDEQINAICNRVLKEASR